MYILIKGGGQDKSIQICLRALDISKRRWIYTMLTAKFVKYMQL